MKSGADEALEEEHEEAEDMDEDILAAWQWWHRMLSFLRPEELASSTSQRLWTTIGRIYACCADAATARSSQLTSFIDDDECPPRPCYCHPSVNLERE